MPLFTPLQIGSNIFNSTVGSVLFSGTSSLLAQDNSNFFWDDTNNRLGIGTAIPGSMLQITTGAAATIGQIIKGASSQSANLLDFQDSSANILASITKDGGFVFNENSVDVDCRIEGNNDANLFYTDAGNDRVGIGLANPAQKFHIYQGHIRWDQVAAASKPTTAINATAGNLNGNYYYSITYVTALGETQYGQISTVVSPVNQQVDLSSIPVSSNAAVTGRKIYRSGPSSDQRYHLIATISDNVTTTYTDNVADADAAAAAGIGGNTTGGNFYIGTAPILRLDASLCSIGYYCGAKGFSNTFIGNEAGYSVTDGYENVALGSSTLYALTTGTANMCLGYSAGKTISTGANNVAIGRASLRYNSTSNNNACFGTNSGFYITGANNLLLGTSAGFGVNGSSSFSNCVCIGTNAGYSLTGNGNQTLIGYYAGRYVTGSGNICLGYNCGDNITSGATNLLIGYDLDAQSATASNQLSIGNLIFGSGGFGTGTSIGAGKIGIKVVSPATALDVVGDARIGDSTTNYVNFDTTGHQTFVGTAKPWEDLRIEPVARTTGVNAPTFEQWADDSGLGDTGTTRGIYLYSFDDVVAGSEKEIHFTMQMPHAWDGGSIYLHVHWIGAVADTTAAPRWGLEYAWKELGADFAATATIIYTDGSNYTAAGTEANITAGRHYISKFAAIAPGTTADAISSVFIGRLFRNSSDAADTYDAAGAKCGLLYIDAHYQIARIGSTDEYTA